MNDKENYTYKRLSSKLNIRKKLRQSFYNILCLSEVKGIDIKDEKKIKKEKNFTHDVSKSRDNDMHNTNSGRNKCSGSNNL